MKEAAEKIKNIHPYLSDPSAAFQELLVSNDEASKKAEKPGNFK